MFFKQWWDTAYRGRRPATSRRSRVPAWRPGLLRRRRRLRARQADDRLRAAGGAAAGRADFDVTATSDSGLPVSFAAAGECTITGRTVHITGPGTCTITASQAGDGVWKPASGRADVRDPQAGRDDRRPGGAVQRLLQGHGLGDRRRLGGLGPDRGRDRSAGRPVAGRRLHLGRGDAAGSPHLGRLGIATVAPGSYPVSVTSATTRAASRPRRSRSSSRVRTRRRPTPGTRSSTRPGRWCCARPSATAPTASRATSARRR